jgi:hypothetical protein
MSELVEKVKAQLTLEYERQKIMLKEERDLNQALQQLEQKYQNLITQVEALENAKAPADLIALYIQTGGKVWISKKVYNQGGMDTLTISGRHIMGNYAPNCDGLQLEKGLYRIVVMALPEPLSQTKTGTAVDDYGTPYPVPLR